jgi:biopolymer transport protein ExbB/TolQ
MSDLTTEDRYVARIAELKKALRNIALMGNYGPNPPMIGLMPTVQGMAEAARAAIAADEPPDLNSGQPNG